MKSSDAFCLGHLKNSPLKHLRGAMNMRENVGETRPFDIPAGQGLQEPLRL